MVINQPCPDYPITCETFELVLRYLYADDLQLETLSGRQALDLAVAAREFDLPRLIRLCHHYLRKAIDLDNVHDLLKVSHDTKEDTVKGFCVFYASMNRKEFIGNKAAVGEMGVDLFQDVMAILLTIEEEVINESEPPPRTIVDDFKKLYTDVEGEATHGDAVVSMKGQEIPFHKGFFAVLSKSLSQSFQPATQGDENVTEVMKVKPALSSADSFRAVLKYVYYGDVSCLTVMTACEVQEFAKFHGMTELQNICEHIMNVTINCESCTSIAKIVFNPGNLKRPNLATTRKNVLTFFRENLTNISLSVSDLLDIGQNVMAEIILAWQIAERAEKEGMSVEDYCKKNGIDDTHRYNDIVLTAADEPQDDKGESGTSSPPLNASATLPNSNGDEEDGEEKEEQQPHQHEKRGLFGVVGVVGRKRDKKKIKKK